MAFNAKGFKTISHMGTPDANAGAGTNRAFHSYITNDDAATVETSAYFNAYAGRLKKGDVIMASLANSGTAALRFYVVAGVAAGVVTIARSQATEAA
jgi:hypothetical protein